MLRVLRICCAGLFGVTSGACTTVPGIATDAAGSPLELTAVPFFPQTEYQCGPAALATVLGASGVDITPAVLVPEVYLPGRHGSLQAELIASVRRHERIPYVIAPMPNALVRELTAGRPVLVLQNFGSRRASIWHFAVVVGYDPGRNEFVLRSGTTARSVVTAKRFAATWRRAGSWAVAVLRATELPADADSQRYLTAVSGVEAAGQRQVAEPAYRAALARWPDDPRAWLGLGNIAWADGRWSDAEKAYRELLVQQPDNVAARNNLALALYRQGCGNSASGEIERAVATAGSGPLAAEVRASQLEIHGPVAAGTDIPSTCLNR
jgi:hypothetical protein